MTTTTAPNQTTNSTQVTTVLTVAKIASGRTQPGATNWQKSNDYVYVDVDTSAAGFAQTPVYVTSIGGDSQHYATTGASSVYSATATGFRIFIRWDKGYKDTAITPEEANGYKWHINWIAIEPFSQQGQGTSTQPSATTTVKSPVEEGKYYRLTTKWLGDGKALDLNGTTKQPKTADTADVTGQYWKFTPLSDGYYRLTTKWLGDTKALDLDGTTKQPKIADTADVTGQYWKITPLGNGYYRLTTKWLGDTKSLDLDGSTQQPKIADTADVTGQYWKFTEITNA